MKTIAWAVICLTGGIIFAPGTVALEFMPKSSGHGDGAHLALFVGFVLGLIGLVGVATSPPDRRRPASPLEDLEELNKK